MLDSTTFDTTNDASADEETSNAALLFRHTKREQWGLGIVVRRLDDRVYMQFEDGRQRTFADGYYDLFESVDRPYDVTMELVHALRSMLPEEEKPTMTGRRKPPIRLDEQIAHFYELYDEGFQSEEYEENHRTDGRKRALKRHRDAVIDMGKELLAKRNLSKMIRDEDYEGVHAAMTKVLKLSDLVGAKERRAFAAIDDNLEAIATSLRALLYGSSKITKRFDSWVTQLEIAMGQTPSWELATFFLGTVHAHEHLVVRPDLVERQAQWMAPGLRCSDRPMGLLYTRLLAMVISTQVRLNEKGLDPRDLLDLRDFMWLTLKPAARKRIMELRSLAPKPAMVGETAESAAA